MPKANHEYVVNPLIVVGFYFAAVYLFALGWSIPAAVFAVVCAVCLEIRRPWSLAVLVLLLILATFWRLILA